MFLWIYALRKMKAPHFQLTLISSICSLPLDFCLLLFHFFLSVPRTKTCCHWVSQFPLTPPPKCILLMPTLLSPDNIKPLRLKSPKASSRAREWHTGQEISFPDDCQKGGSKHGSASHGQALYWATPKDVPHQLLSPSPSSQRPKHLPSPISLNPNYVEQEMLAKQSVSKLQSQKK